MTELPKIYWKFSIPTPVTLKISCSGQVGKNDWVAKNFLDPPSLLSFPLTLKILCPGQGENMTELPNISWKSFVPIPPSLWKYHVQDKGIKMTELLKILENSPFLLLILEISCPGQEDKTMTELQENSWKNLPSLLPLDQPLNAGLSGIL